MSLGMKVVKRPGPVSHMLNMGRIGERENLEAIPPTGGGKELSKALREKKKGYEMRGTSRWFGEGGRKKRGGKGEREGQQQRTDNTSSDRGERRTFTEKAMKERRELAGGKSGAITLLLRVGGKGRQKRKGDLGGQ